MRKSGHHHSYSQPVVGLLGLFGGFDETHHYYTVLSPLLAGVHSVGQIWTNFDRMDELQQAGVFMCGSLEMLAITTVVMSTLLLVQHHGKRAITHLGKINQMQKSWHVLKTKSGRRKSKSPDYPQRVRSHPLIPP